MEPIVILLILGLILILVIKTILVKIRFFNHHFSLMITIAILAFLLIGFIIATSGQDIDLSSGQGIKTAFKLYASWFGNSLENIQGITSNAIKMDWGGNNTSTG